MEGRAHKGFEYPHVRHRHITQGDELVMWKQHKKIQDARRLRRTMHGNQTRSDPEVAKEEFSSLVHQDSEEVPRLLRGWHWADTKGGWLDPVMCARARMEKVGYARHHGVHMRVPRGLCFQEHGRAQIKTGRVETEKGPSWKTQHSGTMGCKGFQDRRSTAATPPL